MSLGLALSLATLSLWACWGESDVLFPPVSISAALPENPVALVVVLTAVLLLLALLTAAFILYRRRQNAERGSFEGARYSRGSRSGPAEATEKNILVSDMEMNEQQE